MHSSARGGLTQITIIVLEENDLKFDYVKDSMAKIRNGPR